MWCRLARSVRRYELKWQTVGVIIAAAILTLSYFWSPTTIGYDGEQYITYARNLLSTSSFTYDGIEPSCGRAPGYPAFLALFLYLFGNVDWVYPIERPVRPPGYYPPPCPPVADCPPQLWDSARRVGGVLEKMNSPEYRLLRDRLKEAQVKAKERGVNLFVIRPDEIPPGLGLLEIDRKVIEQVKTRERKRMKDYLDNLEAHNLRFAPPIQ